MNMKSDGEKVYMRAYSTASGGVIFIPDEIERKTRSISYSHLAGEESVQQASMRRPFSAELQELNKTARSAA
jgi:hypothetical protein